MSEFDQTLAQYGIFAKNGTKSIQKNNITLINADIEKIDFNILQENKIEKFYIENSEVKNIFFAKENDIEFTFSDCIFKNKLLSIKIIFKKDIKFFHCIFEKYVEFVAVEFNSIVNFDISRFNDEVKFLRVNFFSNLESTFKETVFESFVDFSGAVFKGKVDFSNAKFKKAKFAQVHFLAKPKTTEKTTSIEVQNGKEVVESIFFNTIFRDEVSFDSAVFEGRVEFVNSIFKDNVSFLNAKFLFSYSFNQPVKFINSSTQNETIENNFYAITVLGDADFSNAMFKGKTDFSMSNFKGKVDFINTKFLAIQDNTIENNFLWTIFKDNVSFNSVKIKSKISFEFSSFNEKFEFIVFNSLKDNLIFNGINFKKAKFNFLENNTNEGIKITNSNFTEMLEIENINIGESDFQNIVFGGIVIFNEINQTNKIQKKANFINCTFSNQFNIKHDHIQYDYNELKEKNKNTYDEFLNFRDLFRKLKSNRIAHHNLIDASELRAQELYARELELKYKENKNLKEKIEQYQLFFYRKLCDHHTDLLKVFHNLLIIIMLFSVFSFALDKFKQPSIENNAKYHIVQVDTNESYIFKEHNKTTYNFLSLNIEQEFKNLDNLLSKTEIYFSLGFVLLVTFVALLNKKYLWLLLLPFFVGVVYCIGFPISIITHFMIIVLFACTFVFIMVFDSKPERFLFVGVSYIVCIFTLLAKPSLMLPVFGSFLEKDTNATYPLLLSLSVVYFILVALVIFSLQKTARKNSIVPS
ncbi:hypothetical protein A0I57_03830 [Campylobacter lari]|nr:hypothetical protein [Campylobacter lari]